MAHRIFPQKGWNYLKMTAFTSCHGIFSSRVQQLKMPPAEGHVLRAANVTDCS